MSCPHNAAVVRWLDDEVPERLAKRLRVHVANCRACQSTVLNQLVLGALLRGATREETPPPPERGEDD